MSDKATKRRHINDAAYTHSTLNTFAIVETILEGGHLYTGANTAARRIISICQKEKRRLLMEYDRAVKSAGGGDYGDAQP